MRAKNMWMALCSECPLTKRERKSLNAGIEELNLKIAVFYSTLLPDELIEARLSYLAAAVRGGINSTIVA
jgi:hypothetical protein